VLHFGKASEGMKLETMRHFFKKNKNIKVVSVFAAAALLIFVTLITLVLGVYKFQWNGRFISFTEKVIPFPAVYIRDAGIITVSAVKENTASVKRFYESQDFEQVGMRVDFSTDQGKKRLKIKEKEVINKMIENKIIECLAQERGIQVDDNLIDQLVEDSISKFGNRENLVSDLGKLYGWTIEDFKQKVVKPEIYADKLEEVYSQEVDTSKQKKKADFAWTEAVKKKKDFAKLAKELSDGESAKNGGDLGWSTRKQLVSEVSEKAFSMKVGEISEVIQSPLGFHVVKLEDRKSENDEDLVRLRQIFIQIKTFADWLKEKIKEFQIVVLLQDYYWNKGSASVEFTDPNLREFEENLLVNSEGDPSALP